MRREWIKKVKWVCDLKLTVVFVGWFRVLPFAKRENRKSDHCQSIKNNTLLYKVSGIPSGNKLIKTIRYPHI